MLEHKVPYQWVVIYRDFSMPGGIWDIGIMNTLGMYDTYEEAKEEAKNFFETIPKETVDPRVWVCKIESSFVKTSDGSFVGLLLLF